MNDNQFLIYDRETNSRTTSYRVGDFIIPAPTYIPEVKNVEDIRALLRYSSAIAKGNPVMVPAHRWSKLMSDSRVQSLSKGLDLIGNFVKQHPIYLYDPPELYKYALGAELYGYALKGVGIKKFEKVLIDEKDVDKAIGLLPEFFRPFVQKQLESIQRKLGIETGKSERPRVEHAWLDEKINEAYAPYVYGLANEALKMPNAILIPPVPPLIPSSDDAYFERVISSNRMAYLACEKASMNAEFGLRDQRRVVYPYYHLYLDWSIADQGNRGINIERIGDMLEEELSFGAYAGVAVTIIGYENSTKGRSFQKIEHFITQIVNICSQYYLPIILPRSEWFGLALTDLEIQGFGSLLNGKARYMPKGGKSYNPDDKYGKTPLIEKCYEMNRSEVLMYIRRFGQMPSVNGLLDKIPEEVLDNPALYREAFSKPTRFLIHMEEALRIRKEKTKGIIEPAKLYLSRSENGHLKDGYA